MRKKHGHIYIIYLKMVLNMLVTTFFNAFCLNLNPLSTQIMNFTNSNILDKELEYKIRINKTV